MLGWTRSKRDKGRRPRPARLGLLLFALICAGVVWWDGNYRSGGGLTLEQPAVDAAAMAEASAEPATEPAAAPDAPAEEESAAAETEARALFAAYRLERESSREQELALLQEVIDDPQSSGEARREAEQRRLAIAQAVENEAAAESLLRARGFGETVVLISGEQATVICGLELTGASAAQIAAVTADCCGVSFENVIIVNR